MQAPEPLAGSDFYYASLYSGREERARLANINALHVEIASIPLKVSDRGVARVKLNWWHEEADHLAAQKPRHLLTQHYARRYDDGAEVGSALHRLVEGLDQELEGRILRTDAERAAWIDATFASIYTLYAADRAAPAARQLACALGSWIENAYALLLINRMARCGLLRVPEDSLRSAACTRSDLENGTNVSAIARLVGAEVDRALDVHAAIVETAARDAVGATRVLLTWARIVERSLVEMRRDGCRVWLHSIELTPLRKLWCAWRSRAL